MATLDLQRLRIAASLRVARPGASEPASELSRRDVLKLGSFAAIGAPVLFDDGKPSKDFTVQGDERRLVFLVDGIARWTIDPARFDGEPRLRIRKRTESTIRLSLAGARYPGTSLPADFTCTIERRTFGSRMRMRLASARDTGLVSFVDWLLGTSSLRAHAQPVQIAQFGPGGTIVADTARELAFHPDWSLHVEDVSLRARDLDVTGQARIELAERADVLTAEEGSRVTAITIARGSKIWDLGLDRRSNGKSWQLTGADASFDTARIELTANGAAMRAGATAVPQLRLSTGGDLKDAHGNPLALQFASTALGIDDEHERVLLADLGAESQRIAGDGFALDVNDDGSCPALEVHCSGDDFSIACAPCVRNVAVPLQGFIIQTARITDARSRVDISLSPSTTRCMESTSVRRASRRCADCPCNSRYCGRATWS